MDNGKSEVAAGPSPSPSFNTPKAFRRAMSLTMPARPLRLTLRADDHLPADLSWRIDDGYIRANTWNEEGESITLGIWGPGELITPTGCGVKPYELISLTRVIVEECEPSASEVLDFLRDQITQTAHLLQIHRVRPADARLLRLLHWIGARFGRVSSSGTTLSLEDMNLTHRHLADIAGMTRVTVTKSLTRFRSKGLVVKVSEADLLVPRAACLSAVPMANALPLTSLPFPRTLRHEPPAHQNAGFRNP
jgi:CRP-like cAMP-binding protein